MSLVTQPPTDKTRNQIMDAWLKQFVQNFNGLFQPIPPASSTSQGNANSFSYDTGFLYICIAKNTWRRVAISTF